MLWNDSLDPSDDGEAWKAAENGTAEEDQVVPGLTLPAGIEVAVFAVLRPIPAFRLEPEDRVLLRRGPVGVMLYAYRPNTCRRLPRAAAEWFTAETIELSSVEPYTTGALARVTRHLLEFLLRDLPSGTKAEPVPAEPCADELLPLGAARRLHAMRRRLRATWPR